MIPDYIFEGLNRGDIVVYGTPVIDPESNESSLRFYSGIFKLQPGMDGSIKGALNLTDARGSELEKKISPKEFLFRLDQEAFSKISWPRDLWRMMESNLRLKDRLNPEFESAMEKVLDQFPEICRSRKEYFAGIDSSAGQV